MTIVFFSYLFKTITLVLNILSVFLSIRILIEFVSYLMNSEPRRTQVAPIYQIIYSLTEPACIPFKNMIPKTFSFSLYVIMAIAWVYTLMEINTLLSEATLRVLRGSY